MQEIIITLLGSSIILVIAKVILTLVFWMAGLFGIFNFKIIVQEMIDANLPVPKLFAVATIGTQLLGSLLIITNFAGFGWLGAGWLAIFLLLTIPIGHPFWKFDEPKRTHEFHIVLEHITVVGGLMLAGILSVLSAV
ncbi:DoxX family protein [Psychrobacter aestuarii]|uniref:Multidrug efflux RND transporter inhibitory subunit MexG n=1 Tax=Psychrobacter aestuarii TaxID=556327 RepID=A0ABP3FV32_9GAMM|nr:DoxX family protein [Psychrobacter aestuarii]